MKFTFDNLPELGSKVWFVEKDKITTRPTIRSGFVFGHLIRYQLKPLIVVDTIAVAQDVMEYSGGDLPRYSPEFLFESAQEAAAVVDEYKDKGYHTIKEKK